MSFLISCRPHRNDMILDKVLLYYIAISAKFGQHIFIKNIVWQAIFYITANVCHINYLNKHYVPHN
jgi:hypothetical protein